MNGKRWTIEDDQQLAELYQEKVSPAQISKITGRTQCAVWARAHTLNITRDKKNLSDEEKRVIRHGAESGWTLNEISAAIGRIRSTIDKFLRRIGLSVRKERVYPKDEAFFSRLSLESAYFAGLLAADGYISKQGNTISLTLKAEDGYILENIREMTEYRGRVRYYTYNNYKYASIQFASAKRWSDDLQRIYGLHSKKSLTLGPPSDEIKGDLAKAFLVGVIEGDGSIREYNVLYFRLSGSAREFMKWVHSTLEEVTGYQWKWECSLRKNNKTGEYFPPHYYVKLLGKKAADACAQLMEVNVHHMRRKWQLAEAQAMSYGMI